MLSSNQGEFFSSKKYVIHLKTVLHEFILGRFSLVFRSGEPFRIHSRFLEYGYAYELRSWNAILKLIPVQLFNWPQFSYQYLRPSYRWCKVEQVAERRSSFHSAQRADSETFLTINRNSISILNVHRCCQHSQNHGLTRYFILTTILGDLQHVFCLLYKNSISSKCSHCKLC